MMCQILPPQNLSPQRIISIQKLPNPFRQQTLVHNPCINNSQTTKLFRSTNHLPFGHMVFEVSPPSFPEKTYPNSIKLILVTIGQQIETHDIRWNVAKTRVCQDQPSSSRQ